MRKEVRWWGKWVGWEGCKNNTQTHRLELTPHYEGTFTQMFSLKKFLLATYVAVRVNLLCR